MNKMSKMYAKGGKLKMVKKGDQTVPFYAADGEGKMKAGGMTPKTKGYFKGGKTKGYSKGGKTSMQTRGCGAATKGTMHSKKMG